VELGRLYVGYVGNLRENVATMPCVSDLLLSKNITGCHVIVGGHAHYKTIGATFGSVHLLNSVPAIDHLHL
jgi:hypothetical protein